MDIETMVKPLGTNLTFTVSRKVGTKILYLAFNAHSDEELVGVHILVIS